MFGLGFTEILLIAIVAIIFLGPDKLPEAMVNIAKFIKKTKNAISDAKQSLSEEVNIEELKREALGYKAELDKATEELRGFKNINPINEMKEAADLSSVKENFAKLTQLESEPQPQTTQVEKKQEEITFKKKTVKESSLKEVKKEQKKAKQQANKTEGEEQ
jgi:sec-independent protein translocase protein TatB